MKPVVCHACQNMVVPIRKRAPLPDLENISPLFDFGWFCPVEQCGARLDRTIAKSEPTSKSSESELSIADIPDDILPKSEASNASQVRSEKPRQPVSQPAELQEADICERIRTERNRLANRERALTDELAEVRRKRARLDRMVAAMDAEDELVAAE